MTQQCDHFPVPPLIVVLLLISESSRSFSVSHYNPTKVRLTSTTPLEYEIAALVLLLLVLLLFVSIGYYVECVKLCVRGLLILSRADIQTFIMDRHMYDKIMRFQRQKELAIVGDMTDSWMDVM